MHKLTFFPLGNADCCLFDLDNKKKILFDYAHCKDPENEDDLRIDLAAALKADLDKDKRDYYDVVAFTHADDDHIHGFSDFFYLEHAKKYQDEKRIKINELWVPAALIVEEGLEDEAAVLRSEARHRFKAGKNIRVFSRPERLKEWADKEGINIEDRKSIISDAGQLVPGFDKVSQGVEFFVHSPFAIHQEDKLIDHNDSALIMQAIFSYSGVETKLFLSSDATYDILTDIVSITRYHKRDDRLSWDVMKLPHHCSYTALSEEKGKDKTGPAKEVKWLFEQGREKGHMVSTSDIIPNGDTEQPPHRQAANYYKERAAAIKGEFIVTMEFPKKSNLQPLVIKVDNYGATLIKTIAVGGSAIISRSAPRAG